MKVLMLSIDENLLRPESDAALRIATYGSIVDELHVIIYSQSREQTVQLARNVWAYPARSRFPFLFAFDFYCAARKIIVERPGQWLITSQDAFTNLPAFFLRRTFNISLEIQIHTDFLSPYFRNESLKNYLRYLLYSSAIRRADSIRVVSPRIAEGLQKECGVSAKRITVLPIFVDVNGIVRTPVQSDLRNKYPQYDFFVLMASRLTREKNIPLALRAFADVARRFTRAGLIIVGDGPEKNSLKLKVKSLKLDEHVILEPMVSFETLISYYKTADLFLFTSNYEGYGRSLVEATAAKLPVITTDVGISREIFVDGVTGVIIPVGDTDACRNALFDAIENYPRFKMFGEKAGAMLLDAPPQENAYLRAMKHAWGKCLAVRRA